MEPQQDFDPTATSVFGITPVPDDIEEAPVVLSARDREAVNALPAAHGVLIPLEAEYFAMRGVALLTEQIERVQERLNPRLQTDGVLLTMVDTRTLHSREVANSVRQGFGDTVYTTYISRTVKFPDATIAAAPITLYAPSHPGSVAYRQLAREIVARGQCA